jgi:LPXTG-site transpeptidase (sortase) family protein
MKFGKILIFLGILLLIFGNYLVYERYSSKKLEFESVKTVKTANSTSTPVKITIPSLGIENTIYGAKIIDNNWETTTRGISYLSDSPVPGEKGNSILYGHNWPSLLGNLTKIKTGDKINVTMDNGEERIFIVKFTYEVNPNQTQILNPTNDRRITIYTCTGFLDSKRFVVTALLENSNQLSSRK